MDFNFNFNPPDPEKITQAIYRLQDAFSQAAEAPTGKAQRSFERLSDAFNQLAPVAQSFLGGDLDPQALEQLAETLPAFVDSFLQVKQLTRTNPQAASAFGIIEQALQEERSALLEDVKGMLPPGLLDGFRFPGSVPPDSAPEDTLKKADPKPRPKRRKPGNGDFSL